MNCKNCEASLQGSFCSTCGQKAEIHRITFKHVLHELIHAFTHTDRGFFLLIKSMIIKPGMVAREYLEGKRKKYFNPLSFLVITAALHLFAVYHSGYFDGITNSGSAHMPAIWKEAFAIVNSPSLKMLDLFLLVPLISILSWLFFRRPKYYLSEHFVLQAFVLSQAFNLRTFIFVPLHLLLPQLGIWRVWLFQICLLIFMIFAYKQFFRQNIFLTILKTLLIMVMYVVLFWALILLYVYLKHLLF